MPEIESSARVIVLLTIAGYLGVMLFVGFLAARFSSASLTHYFLGGRKMKDWVVALSAVASGRSAWLVVGVSGMAYARGLSAIWALPGYVLVELFMFWFVGVRLRRFSAMSDDITVPDYLESRFRDTTHILRIASVVLFFLFVAPYLAAQFSAGGKAFASSIGVSPVWGVTITALIVLVYTVLGGFLGVSLTDVLQALLMIIGLLVLPIVCVYNAGGVGEVLHALQAQDAALVDPLSLGLGALIGFLGIGLGSPGNPHILVRYMSIENPDRLRRSALYGTLWNVLMGWGAIWIGLAGRTFIPENILPGGDTEYIFPALAAQFFPPVLLGLMIAAILAAIMSTADSQILIVASGVTRDIIQKLTAWGKRLSERSLVALSRWVVVLLVLVGLLASLLAELEVLPKDKVFWLVLFAWSGLGASFGPAVIISLYWRRMTVWGAFAGIVTGAVVTVLWKSIPAIKNLISDNIPALKGLTYELVPAFILACIAIWTVSLLTRPKPEAVRDREKLTADAN